MTRRKKEGQRKDRARREHHERAGRQIIAEKRKKRAERAGEHAEERGEQEHAVHAIGQQISGGGRRDQHRRNEHHADGLQRDHHREGEQQHEQAFEAVAPAARASARSPGSKLVTRNSL